MNIKPILLGLLLLVSFLCSAEPEDLGSDALASLLSQTLQEQGEETKVSDKEHKDTASNEGSAGEKSNDKKQDKGNVFVQSNTISGYSPEEYNEKAAKLRQILSQVDDPKGTLETLIAEGGLEISFNDIFLMRLVADEVQRAKNTPIIDTEIINDQYSIDHTDRFKMYDLYVHTSGDTLIEFLDVTGQPWPIHDKSSTKSLDITKGELNTLEISPTEKYKNTNFFVTLKEYGAPIQFNVIYKNSKRHGFASFKLPFISPINPKANAVGTTSNTFDLELAGNRSSNSGSEPQTFINEQLDTRELSYLASTGRFKEGTKLKNESIPVVVSDPTIAKVWFYSGHFIVRTSNQMYSFDRMINSAGPMKVFVASNLNSIVPFNRNGQNVNLFIPEYHSYVGQK
ncbi:conserved exported hypothetical protein [Vibrio chagasii]|nr:conserved exported hypothetical protein [Vibrio chagasii]CAH6952333.1 conserved exported hypothetical protein [Vibrio chagasii]